MSRHNLLFLIHRAPRFATLAGLPVLAGFVGVFDPAFYRLSALSVRPGTARRAHRRSGVSMVALDLAGLWLPWLRRISGPQRCDEPAPGYGEDGELQSDLM